MIVAWAIPDVPRTLRDQTKREVYLTREIIIEHEKKRSKFNRSSMPTPTPHRNGNFNENDDFVRRRKQQNGDIESTAI